jgi:hypothetical protein
MTFDAFDLFPDTSPEEPAPPAFNFDGIKRGDILTLCKQKYEVVQMYDNYHLSVKKPGAKRKYFLLRHDIIDGIQVITVREEKGIWEETYKQPVIFCCEQKDFKRG